VAGGIIKEEEEERGTNSLSLYGNCNVCATKWVVSKHIWYFV
jgi:hypothetical protein